MEVGELSSGQVKLEKVQGAGLGCTGVWSTQCDSLLHHQCNQPTGGPGCVWILHRKDTTLNNPVVVSS